MHNRQHTHLHKNTYLAPLQVKIYEIIDAYIADHQRNSLPFTRQQLTKTKSYKNLKRKLTYIHQFLGWWLKVC